MDRGGGVVEIPTPSFACYSMGCPACVQEFVNKLLAVLHQREDAAARRVAGDSGTTIKEVPEQEYLDCAHGDHDVGPGTYDFGSLDGSFE